MQTVTVTFELEDDTNVGSFLETIGQNLPYVLSAQQLAPDGDRAPIPVGDKLDFATGQF